MPHTVTESNRRSALPSATRTDYSRHKTKANPNSSVQVHLAKWAAQETTARRTPCPISSLGVGAMDTSRVKAEGRSNKRKQTESALNELKNKKINCDTLFPPHRAPHTCVFTSWANFLILLCILYMKIDKSTGRQPGTWGLINRPICMWLHPLDESLSPGGLGLSI